MLVRKKAVILGPNFQPGMEVDVSRGGINDAARASGFSTGVAPAPAPVQHPPYAVRSAPLGPPPALGVPFQLPTQPMQQTQQQPPPPRPSVSPIPAAPQQSVAQVWMDTPFGTAVQEYVEVTFAKSVDGMYLVLARREDGSGPNGFFPYVGKPSKPEGFPQIGVKVNGVPGVFLISGPAATFRMGGLVACMVQIVATATEAEYVATQGLPIQLPQQQQQQEAPNYGQLQNGEFGVDPRFGPGAAAGPHNEYPAEFEVGPGPGPSSFPPDGGWGDGGVM